jgi:DNA polymerase/3'-5' exonuclease PolX
MDNRVIAQKLTQVARYLGEQEASLYRARAYRRAAETVLGLDEPIADIVARHGRRGLQELPGIGPGIARTIETLVHTGELSKVKESPNHQPV